VEYRYRAVREVLGGSPIGEVAARYGTSRQSLHASRRRFELEGMPGLADRSRRPARNPRRRPRTGHRHSGDRNGSQPRLAWRAIQGDERVVELLQILPVGRAQEVGDPPLGPTQQRREPPRPLPARIAVAALGSFTAARRSTGRHADQAAGPIGELPGRGPATAERTTPTAISAKKARQEDIRNRCSVA
jgi:hypothetical protein